MSALPMVKSSENDKYWKDMRNSQMDSIYAILNSTVAIPSRERVSNITRETPMEWNPTDVIEQYNRQSDASYA